MSTWNRLHAMGLDPGRCTLPLFWDVVDPVQLCYEQVLQWLLESGAVSSYNVTHYASVNPDPSKPPRAAADLPGAELVPLASDLKHHGTSTSMVLQVTTQVVISVDDQRIDRGLCMTQWKVLRMLDGAEVDLSFIIQAESQAATEALSDEEEGWRTAIDVALVAVLPRGRMA